MDTEKTENGAGESSHAPDGSSVRDTATVFIGLAVGGLLLRAVGAIGDETLGAAIYWPGITTLGVWLISHCRSNVPAHAEERSDDSVQADVRQGG